MRVETAVVDAAARIAERVAVAASRVGRDPRGVTIVAATKEADVDAIASAARAGIRDFGENRAKDLAAKAGASDPALTWHYLGAIQTNKVRFLDRAAIVHSLDRLREAEALELRGDRVERSWDVLIEVNIAGEAQKQGIPPAGLAKFLDGLGAYPRVRPRGLMFVAPQVENPEDVRAMFAEARALGERFGLRELSMGMSDDFEVAVEEGSTIVRIGRAIFRPGSE
jgi:pyridoxal phosphate enzyme (YggS family)